MRVPKSVAMAKAHVDVTEVFAKACSDYRGRLDTPSSSSSSSSSKLFRSTRLSSSLEWRARTLWKSIDELVDFLESQSQAYLDVVGLDDHFNRSQMDKEAVDAETDAFVHRVQKLLKELRADLKMGLTNSSEQELLNAMQSEHISLTLDMLEQHLRSACQRYARQKALRVERELQHQKFYRLEVGARYSRQRKNVSKTDGEDSKHDKNMKVNNDHDNHNHHEGIEEPSHLSVSNDESNTLSNKGNGNEALKKKKKEESYGEKSAAFSDDEPQTADSETSMSAEERRLLESENSTLWQSLVSSVDLVASMESKVIRIAELQDVFTEKVLQQKDDLELIANNTVNATENVKDGNEEMRKAIQNQASIRIYILFFLLVMSLTLLFLDWYND